MKPMLACTLAMLVAVMVPARAEAPTSVRDQVEVSMVLTGTVDIDPDGKVMGYKIDRTEDVPVGVLGLLARFAPGWRFDPSRLERQAASTRAQMSVRVVAKRQADDSFVVSIRDARFGGEAPPSQKAPKQRSSQPHMGPPRYPRAAAMAGVSGSVYLIVRAGRDGHVLDAFAEQVDLRVVGSEYALARWRKLMAEAALDAARSWVFNAPTGEDALADSWVVRVPVDFSLGREKRYGEWQAYVPGPWQPPPWAGVPLAGGPGALPTSGILPVARELRLLTPAGGGD